MNTWSLYLDYAEIQFQRVCIQYSGSRVHGTVHETHKLSNSVNFSSKLSLTVLFIYLKIILLQCFQFLVINDIQTNPKVEELHSTNHQFYNCGLNFSKSPQIQETSLWVKNLESVMSYTYIYFSRVLHKNSFHL